VFGSGVSFFRSLRLLEGAVFIYSPFALRRLTSLDCKLLEPPHVNHAGPPHSPAAYADDR
jgi:hypothetical protein